MAEQVKSPPKPALKLPLPIDQASLSDRSNSKNPNIPVAIPPPSPLTKQGSTKQPAAPTATSPQSTTGITQQTPKYMRELDRKYRDTNYFELAASLRTQLPTRKNTYILRAYPNTLVGTEITKWLIANSYAITLTEANYLGGGLMEHGHIYDVLDENEEVFQGGGRLYKWAVDDRIEFSVDEIDSDLVEKFLWANLKRREVVIKYITIRDVFVASEAIELILQKGFVSSREEAVRLGEKLRKESVITFLQSPSSKPEFSDSTDSLYSLRDPSRHGSKIGITASLLQEVVHDYAENDSGSAPRPLKTNGSTSPETTDGNHAGDDPSVDGTATNPTKTTTPTSRVQFHMAKLDLLSETDSQHELQNSSPANTTPSSKAPALKSLLSPRAESGLSKQKSQKAGVKAVSIQLSSTDSANAASENLTSQGSMKKEKSLLRKQVSIKKPEEESGVEGPPSLLRSVTGGKKSSDLGSRSSSKGGGLLGSRSSTQKSAALEAVGDDLMCADVFTQNQIIRDEYGRREIMLPPKDSKVYPQFGQTNKEYR